MDILVVDDSRTMRMIVQRAIRQAGYRSLVVGEAGDGKQALEQLAASGEPKLILSDWNMPEMSGLDLLMQVRSTTKIPFGFITSEGSPQMRDLAIAQGADFLITKPFSPEDVQDALSPFFGNS